MKSTRNILIPGVFMLLSASGGFAQNKKELLKYADDAFKNENYVASAYFYGKVVGSFLSGAQDLVYPYEFVGWNEPVRTADSDTSKLDSIPVQEFLGLEPESVDSAATDEERVLKKVKNDQSYRRALYNLAESYRLSYNYRKAESVYRQCTEMQFDEYPLLQFWLALSMKQNMKYDEAQTAFNDFIKSSKSAPYTDSLGTNYYKRAKIELSGCRQAETWIAKPVPGIKVDRMDSSVNAGIAAFSATYAGNEGTVLYATARAVPGASRKDLDEIQPCDIYTIGLNNDSTWGNPKIFSGPVNTYKHEGGAAMSADESKLFFTRWGETDGVKECHIYLSKNFNGRWLPPQRLNDKVNIKGYKSKDPYVTPDGTKLYFSSNRPGGAGRMDLWYCTMDESGNLEDPKNVGWPVNTKEDEVSPVYLPDEKTLYFSSNGHVGMGGLDVFEAFGELEELYRPENLGYPINSSKDDQYFILNKNMNKGFLSSDRADCENCDAENCLQLYEIDYGPPQFTLSGHVYTKLDKRPIPNALVTIKDVNEYYEPLFIISDKDGYYFTPLRREMIYYLKAQKVKYFADAKDVSTEGIEKSTDFVRDFFLPRIPIGEIEIKGIFYDYDKWDLRPESKVTLDSLVIFLNINNNITIELSSHTDNRGQDDYNLKLSQKRAQSVVDYLVGKGIALERLTPVGYGEQRPVIKDAETEEEHQKNRRTAFEVLREDYVPLEK